MVGPRAGVHPRWHRAALHREKRVAAGFGQAFAVDVRAGGVAVHRVEAIEEAPAVIVIDAVEVVR